MQSSGTSRPALLHDETAYSLLNPMINGVVERRNGSCIAKTNSFHVAECVQILLMSSDHSDVVEILAC